MTPTAGPVHVYQFAYSDNGADLGLYEVEEANEQITDLRDFGKDTEAIAVAEANVELIKQAFDTYTETGLTPRELAEQRDALLAENAKLKTVNEALVAACIPLCELVDIVATTKAEYVAKQMKMGVRHLPQWARRYQDGE